LRPLLIALAVGLSAWLIVLLVSGDGDDIELTVGEPQIVSIEQLKSFAEDADRTIYWAGERPTTVYELTETESGRIYVRYLPGGSEAGERGVELLTVGTYPVGDAAAALERAARAEGKELARSDGGAVVLLDTKRAENVHMAYPGAPEQIEVYSPTPRVALRLASEDGLSPVS
jgi:hypothetical protein